MNRVIRGPLAFYPARSSDPSARWDGSRFTRIPFDVPRRPEASGRAKSESSLALRTCGKNFIRDRGSIDTPTHTIIRPSDKTGERWRQPRARWEFGVLTPLPQPKGGEPAFDPSPHVAGGQAELPAQCGAAFAKSNPEGQTVELVDQSIGRGRRARGAAKAAWGRAGVTIRRQDERAFAAMRARKHLLPSLP